MSNAVSRNRVYAVIDGERAYQIDQKGNAKRHEGQPEMTPGEQILCLEHLVLEARKAWYQPDGGTACLPHIRKLAAIAVQCMELHGAPVREGYEGITEQSTADRGHFGFYSEQDIGDSLSVR